MILDRRQNIGQHDGENACKLLIEKPAPVAQGIEHPPPNPLAAYRQALITAGILACSLSRKTLSRCAEKRVAPWLAARILDSE